MVAAANLHLLNTPLFRSTSRLYFRHEPWIRTRACVLECVECHGKFHVISPRKTEGTASESLRTPSHPFSLTVLLQISLIRPFEAPFLERHVLPLIYNCENLYRSFHASQGTDHRT